MRKLEIVYNLYDGLQLKYSPKPFKIPTLFANIKAENIRKKNNYRALTVALDALEILGNPNTLEEAVLGLNIAPFAGASGRKYTILHGEVYLELKNIDLQKAYALTDENSMIIYQLARAYEQEYNLGKAYQVFNFLCQNTVSIMPYYITGSTRVLNKLGEMDTSIKILEYWKTTKEYQGEYKINFYGDSERNYFKEQIDLALEDAKIKKAKNYKYRPRPQN